MLFLVSFILCAATLLGHSPAESPFCSQQEMPEHFKAAKEQAEVLWDAFRAGREFTPFQLGRSDLSLKEEFETIYQTRKAMWDMPGYERAVHLIEADLIRAPGCVAFAYNNTVPYYNASTIFLGDTHYIACEGPRAKDIPAFFHLLKSQRVTHLIRLTGSYEAWTKKCHPYWDGHIAESEGTAYLKIPTDCDVHSVRVFQMDHWRDNQGIDPEELLSFALQVKNALKKGDLLTVHCSAGVGRTGTFLAALAIIDTIDQRLPLSIEEIVYRLSLQRVNTVSRLSQYITLYRMAELYSSR